MRIAVLTEISDREERVALTPDSVGKLKKAGVEILVQSGAGDGSGSEKAQPRDTRH